MIPVKKRKTQADLNFKEKKREIRQLTTAERKASRKRQEERRDLTNKRLLEVEEEIDVFCESLSKDLGKSAKHWKRVLMQNSRLKRLARKVSQWNAFVAIMLEEYNKGQSPRLYQLKIENDLSLDRPDGKKKSANCPEVAEMLSVRWAMMSAEERDNFTKDRREKMEEDRKTKATGQHTQITNAFHDTNKTLASVEKQVSVCKFMGRDEKTKRPIYSSRIFIVAPVSKSSCSLFAPRWSRFAGQPWSHPPPESTASSSTASNNSPCSGSSSSKHSVFLD